MNTKVEWDSFYKKTVEGLDYTCPKCGMVFKSGVTFYSCINDKCPTFIKISL